MYDGLVKDTRPPPRGGHVIGISSQRNDLVFKDKFQTTTRMTVCELVKDKID